MLVIMEPEDIPTINIQDLNIDLSGLNIFSASSTCSVFIDDNWFYEYEKREEWVQINKAARENPELQRAIDRVKILYHLSKEDGNS